MGGRELSIIRLFAIGTLALSATLSTPAAHGATYNAVRDYSIKVNPTGPWSYMDENGLLTTRTRSEYGIKGLWNWSNGQPICSKSYVSRNQTGSTVNYGSLVQPTNYLRLDPEANTFNTVRFQAPNAGIYNVTGSFLGIDTVENSHQVTINLNGVPDFTAT